MLAPLTDLTSRIYQASVCPIWMDGQNENFKTILYNSKEVRRKCKIKMMLQKGHFPEQYSTSLLGIKEEKLWSITELEDRTNYPQRTVTSQLVLLRGKVRYCATR
uniref:Uncharacterized protein n=1 Tax=Megaselia scalaris TaxID=36166 RepID=T1GQ76_MEGSC